MRKIRKMHAKKTYLFKSIACSNTVYFEKLDHAKNFLELARQHLKGYLYIHEYMICKDGWVFVARLRSEEQIKRAYDSKRQRKGKSPKELPTWKIISEQIRLFISGYVGQYNEQTGREGTLVKRTYERYYFERKKEALRMIKRIRRRVVGMQQGKKMYRAKKGHYRIPKQLGKGGIYMSSKRDWRKKGGKKKIKKMLDTSVFQLFTNKVVTKKIKKLVQSTIKAHSPPIP